MKRILVCDDEPHIVEGLRHLLRGQERQIQTASCGAEALQRIQQSPPDLLIIDIMMPGMSGLEVVAALREDERFRSLPVVILTAKGHANHSVMARDVWDAHVVAKPFEPHRLRELVASLLEGQLCLTGSST